MHFLTSVRFTAMVQVLIFCDIFMRDQEQNNLALLILDGNYVQQTPELGAFLKRSQDKHVSFYSKIPYVMDMIDVDSILQSYHSSCTE